MSTFDRNRNALQGVLEDLLTRFGLRSDLIERGNYVFDLAKVAGRSMMVSGAIASLQRADMDIIATQLAYHATVLRHNLAICYVPPRGDKPFGKFVVSRPIAVKEQYL